VKHSLFILFLVIITINLFSQTKSEYPVNKEIPLGMKAKKQISPEKLQKKKESWYFVGLPFVTYSTDQKLGYGGRLYFIENGSRTNAFYKYTPYQHRLFAQFFKTTGGVQYHWLSYDAPYLLNSLFRLRIDLAFEKNTHTNYFGVGADARQPLSFQGQTYDQFADYDEQIRKLDGNQTSSYYNKFEYEKPIASITFEREILNGQFRPLINFRFEKITVTDYTGQQVNTTGNIDASITENTDGVMRTTKLLEDYQAGKIKGFDGGWNNSIKIAFSYDTRDFEPDPTKGIFTELSYEIFSKILGSSFDYQHVALSPKFYFSPIPKIAKIVLASRTYYSVKTGNIPFYAMNSISQTSGNAYGLGGGRTLRGYSADRFVGKVMALANFEIRYTFAELGSNQHFAFMVVPFIDVGRTFDSVEETVLEDFKYSYGLALRIAWNQATIIMIDYGMSKEGSGLYIDFSHIF